MKKRKTKKASGIKMKPQKTNDFKFPLVGLGTCYYEFSKENPDAGVHRYRGGMRRLLETELAMARCEFDKLKGYYETLDQKDPLYLAGVTNCVVGALGRGDLKLFDRILKDLQGLPERNPHPHARLGREITEAWIRQFLRVRRGHPEWMVRGNLTLIPEEWKRQCAYLCVKGMFVRHEYDSAYAAASMLLNFDRRKDDLSAFPVYERLVCGLACHELGHREEAFSWFRQTAEMCCPRGIILPFVLLVAWLGPMMEDVIREVAPELVEKVRRIAPKFFVNLIRFHNHFAGEAVTTELNPREFYLAQQLVAGYSYKEIAAKLGVSNGRVNDLVRAIYGKLGVHGKAELAKLV